MLIEYLNLNLITNPGDSFVINSNLNPSDQIFNPYFGNMTIAAIERHMYLGAERTVVLGATNYTKYYWDRQTGILVQATSSIPAGVLGDYNFTVFTKTSGTNIWQPQIFGVDLDVFSVLTIVLVGLVAVAVFLVWRTRKHNKLVT